MNKIIEEMGEYWASHNRKLQMMRWSNIESVWPDSISTYAKLPEGKKQYLQETQEGLRDVTFAAYMFLWSRIGQPELEFVFIDDWGYIKLQNKIKKTYPSSRPALYSYSESIPYRIVGKFKNLCHTYVAGESVLLYTLRNVYGEAAIEEYLDRQLKEAPQSTIFHMVTILELWNDVRGLPLNWGLELASITNEPSAV